MTPSSGARVLVAGAGYVGSLLAERLHSRGANVFTLRRKARHLPSELNPIAADVFDPPTLSGLPSSLDVVVYCVSPDGHDDEAYRRAYVEGLGNLLGSSALTEAPRARILFTSSTAVYGQTDGSLVDENSETQPPGFSGQRLLQAEDLLRRSGRPHVIVRLGGIYGPGRDRLVRQALRGDARYPAEPTFTNRIHREDCAGALLHLIELPTPDRLYVGVDCEPAELKKVQTFICTATHSPPPLLEQAPRPLRGGNKRCSSLRLQRSGYAFAFPTFREGYSDLIASSRT